MSAKFEAFLARIYVDAEARTRFLADPQAAATLAGLSPDETGAAVNIDRLGLEMTVRSLQHKRGSKRPHRH